MKFELCDVPLFLNNARAVAREKYPGVDYLDLEALAIIELDFYLERQLWPANNSVGVH